MGSERSDNPPGAGPEPTYAFAPGIPCAIRSRCSRAMSTIWPSLITMQGVFVAMASSSARCAARFSAGSAPSRSGSVGKGFSVIGVFLFARSLERNNQNALVQDLTLAPELGGLVHHF